MDTKHIERLSVADFATGTFEIRCTSEPLPRPLIRRIKQALGHYTECRQQGSYRHITLPLCEKQLADEIIRTLGRRDRVSQKVGVNVSVWHKDGEQVIHVYSLQAAVTSRSVSPEDESPSSMVMLQFVHDINTRRRRGELLYPIALHEFRAEAQMKRDAALAEEQRKLDISRQVALSFSRMSIEAVALALRSYSQLDALSKHIQEVNFMANQSGAQYA